MAGLKPAPRTQFTRAQFIAFLKDSYAAVYVWPYEVVPCACGDHNCHGWRLVEIPRARVPLDPRQLAMEAL